MRGCIVCLVLALLFFCVAFSHENFALADSAVKPLMIIRFGDSPVDYEQSLDRAVKITLAKKPSVMFDVISVVAQKSDKSANQQNDIDSKLFAERVVAQIKQGGVSNDRIHTREKITNLSKTNEIQIFVQ